MCITNKCRNWKDRVFTVKECYQTKMPCFPPNKMHLYIRMWECIKYKILIHRQSVFSREDALCFPQNEMHLSIYRVVRVWMWLPAPAILVPANNTSVRPGCCNFASNSGSKRWRSDSRSWGTESTQHSLRVLFNLNVSCCVCCLKNQNI